MRHTRGTKVTRPKLAFAAMRTDGPASGVSVPSPEPSHMPDVPSEARSCPLPSASSPENPTVGQKAVRGAFWTIGLAVGSKVITFATQMALAWLLVPEAFGLIGQAYTVTAFAGLIVNPGIDRILIQRYVHRRRWLGPAFWMSFVLSLIGTAAMLAAIPLAVAAYQSPELWTLVPVVALATPLGALGLVPRTMLLAEMDFKRLTLLSLVLVGLGSALSVIAATLGYGATSFVIGLPIATALQTAIAWKMVHGRVKTSWRPRFRRWRYLIGDSSALFIFGIATTFIAQADYATIGWLYNEEVLGIYFFAFGLSIQTFVLVNAAVASVTLPSLASVQCSESRATLLKTGVILISMVSIPFAFLQLVLTGPLVSIFFPERWLPSIPIVQILCVGMAFRTLGVAAQSLMQAEGRYWQLVRFIFLEAIVFAILLLPLTAYFSNLGAAIAVATTSVLANFMWLALALNKYPEQQKESIRKVLRMCVIATIPALPCWLIADESMGSSSAFTGILSIIVAVAYASTTAWLLWRFEPTSWKLLVEKLQRRRTVQPTDTLAD